MGLEIWFREDIERIVNALELTAQRQKPDDPSTSSGRSFQAGFLAALQAMRAAFGLPQTTPVVPGLKEPGYPEGDKGVPTSWGYYDNDRS